MRYINTPTWIRPLAANAYVQEVIESLLNGDTESARAGYADLCPTDRFSLNELYPCEAAAIVGRPVSVRPTGTGAPGAEWPWIAGHSARIGLVAGGPVSWAGQYRRDIIVGDHCRADSKFRSLAPPLPVSREDRAD